MGRMDWEFRTSRCRLLYIEWINNKVLLYTTKNSSKYFVMNHDGKKFSLLDVSVVNFVSQKDSK